MNCTESTSFDVIYWFFAGKHPHLVQTIQYNNPMNILRGSFNLMHNPCVWGRRRNNTEELMQPFNETFEPQ